MTAMIKEAMVAVALCWAVAGYGIWKWGPGLRRHWIRCPEKKRRATVVAEQREAEFGSLRVADIKACSLLTPSHPDCSKQCKACI